MFDVRDTTFELTGDLVKLLRASYVNRYLTDCEYGAAAIDDKRPYGNSDVEDDIAEILGWEIPDYEGDEWDAFASRCRAVHEQTPTALQVVLSTGSFEPGMYVRPASYSREWKRAEASS